MKKRVMVSAIEVSADFHLAHLIKAIKKQNSNVEYFGLAGHHCADQGVHITADLTPKSTIGFLEPLKHLPFFIKNLLKAKKLLKKETPDLLLLVDGQGFNMPLAAEAKKLGIPVFYYIPPQEWQWGTKEGGKKVVAVVDKIFTLFKDAADFYNELGCEAYFNGHPLLDIVKPNVDKKTFCEKNGLNANKKIIGLFPGSRKQELKYLLPVLMEMVNLIKEEDESIQFVMSAATLECYKKIMKVNPPQSNRDKLEQEKKTPPERGIIVLEDQNYNIMAHSDFIVTATGTTTLEVACLLKPMIAVYKFSELSYRLIKKLVGHKIPKYAALPNIWLDKMAVPEFIQVGVEAENLKNNVLEYLKYPERIADMQAELTKLSKTMGTSGALEKNGSVIADFLQ